jgi:hypothetical protein
MLLWQAGRIVEQHQFLPCDKPAPPKTSLRLIRPDKIVLNGPRTDLVMGNTFDTMHKHGSMDEELERE